MDNVYKNCPPKMGDTRWMTDYRSANTREQHNKYKNGIVDDDEYRMFLQNNGSTLMDNTWQNLKGKTCKSSVCIHTNFPTRLSPGQFYQQINLHDKVKTGKILANDKDYPLCPQYNDYRASDTPGTLY